MQRKNMWKEYTEDQQKELEELSVRYKECLDIGKTERECVKLGKKMADTWGYQNLEVPVDNQEVVNVRMNYGDN
jgi:hypothetical protein